MPGCGWGMPPPRRNIPDFSSCVFTPRIAQAIEQGLLPAHIHYEVFGSVCFGAAGLGPRVPLEPPALLSGGSCTVRSWLILLLLNQSPHASQPLTLGGSGRLRQRAQRGWDCCCSLPLH